MTTPTDREVALEIDRRFQGWLMDYPGIPRDFNLTDAITAALAAARRDATPKSLSEMTLHELQDLASRANAALARRVLGDPMQGVTGHATAIRQPGQGES